MRHQISQRARRKTAVPRWKCHVAAAVALSSSLMLAACGSDEKDGEVRVATAAGYGTLPVYVAQEQGIFERNGLDVNLTEGQDHSSWMAALGKQYDIAMTTPPTFLEGLTQGLDVVAVSGVMTTTQESPNNVLVTREPIESLTELEGKTIGAGTLTGIASQSLTYVLDAEGVDSSDFKVSQVDFGSLSDQLAAGRIFGAVVPSPFFAQLKTEGNSVWPEDVAVTAVQSASDGQVQDAVAALFNSSTEWADDNPEVIEAWRTSLEEAIKWIAEHEDEARDLLTKWLGLPADVVEQTDLPVFVTDITGAQLEPFVVISEATGAVGGDLPDMDDAVWSE